MNPLRINSLLALAAILSTALLSGCNSLNTMISDETKYGQLYMLEAVLSDAGADCTNEQHLFDAKQWALHVSISLTEHITFLDEEGASYRESKKLLKQLPLISGYYGNASCGAIALAGEQTRILIRALTAEPIVVASR
ncbi:MAG: hypothetical protein OQL08_12200 [Gammaproteobacteria bacterium]|nr:hypothetical protein [Gammaproteobacteria bacterium]